MSGYVYQDGALAVDGVRLDHIAEQVGTPVYCYAAAMIEAAFEGYRAALADLDPLICYAAKANANLAILRTLVARGAGVDVVSAGELRRALAAGAAPDRIIFSGVGKTDGEIRAALTERVQINAESVPELQRISELAQHSGNTASVALRVNPDVAARSHHKISTGNRETKFGIDLDHAASAYRLASELPGLAPAGLAVHIGSQLTSLDPYEAAYRRIAALTMELRGAGLAVDHLDLGGGLGIAHGGAAPPDLTSYARIVRRTVGHLGCRLAFEPGRSIVGPAGVLLSRVIFVKEGLHRRFLILDAGMNDLIRPTLYEAHHDIRPILEPEPGAAMAPVDVVGPICETGDLFASRRPLPPIAAGDLVAIEQAGAYGAVMASNYNGRALPPEVLIRAGRFAVVRPRLDDADLLARERAWPPDP